MSSSKVFKRKGKEEIKEEQHSSDNPEYKKLRVDDDQFFTVEARKWDQIKLWF